MDTVIAFYQGLSLPLRAARVIAKSPKLFLFSTLPLGVSFLLTFLTGSALQSLIQGGTASLVAGLGLSLTGWLGSLVSAIATLIAVLLGAMLFTGFASWVATPFNDFLAEAAEPAAGLQTVPPLRLGLRLKLIWIDGIKSAVALIVVITATAFSWVPVLNLLGLTLAAFAITFQYITYPQTRRNLGLQSSLGFLKSHPASCFGFGVAYGFLFSIPVVSAFVIPLAVVGGTLLFGEKSEKPSEHRIPSPR